MNLSLINPRHFFCLFLSLFLISNITIAQHSCGAAVTIVDGYTANNVSTPGNGGTEDWVSTTTNCSANTGYFTASDVFLYTFTTGATAPSNFSMTVNSNNEWTALMLFTGCSGSTFSGCIDDDSNGSSTGTLTVSSTGLVANTIYYVAVGQWGAPHDLDYDVTNVTLTYPCTEAVVTPAVVPDCGNGQFTIDVNVSDLSGGAVVDISDGGLTAGFSGVGTGNYSMGAYVAGTSVNISVDNGTGCIYNSATLIEDCACTTSPTATVVSLAPDCITSTFDVQVTVDSDGDGDANLSDILIDGVVVQADVTLGNTYSFNQPLGNYTVTVQAEGAGFITCVSPDYTANGGCTNDVCTDAFTVTVDGTPTSSIDVSNYSNTPNPGSCEHHISNETTPDSWYSFMAPASGMVSISIDNSNLAGGGYESEAVLYDDCTLTSCTVDWAWNEYLENGNVATGLTPGSAYYLVVSNQTNQGGTAYTTGTFDVIIEDLAPPLSLGVAECSAGLTYPSIFDEVCNSSCSWLSDSDADALFTYIPSASGTVDIKITDISDGGETLQEMGFIFTDDLTGGTSTCIAEACHSSPLTTDLIATGVTVVGGTTYYLIVNYDGFDSTPSASFCATISAPCAGSTNMTSIPTVDCTAETYTGRINFSALGGAITYDLEDDDGNSFTGIASSTDYDFNYSDLSSHTITLKGYDGGGNLICLEEISVSSGCNGSDNWSLTAPNILGTCYPGDLSTATVGSATGFSPLCDDGGAGGSTGNNVIRNCTAANFDNNTDFVDLWYQVDLPDGTDEMTLTVSGLGMNEILGYVLHTGDPGSDASANVATVTGNFVCSFFDQTVGSHTITGLADESTAPIYIRILPINFNDNDGCSGMVYPDFSICASAPQPNDACSNAINITVNNLDDTGSAETNDFSLYNDEGNSIDCTGMSVSGGDAWYEILYPDVPTAMQNFYTEISLTGMAGDMVRVLIYDNTSACGSAGDISDVDYCEDITLTGGTDVTTIGDLVTSDGFDRLVQIVPIGSVGEVTVSATVVNENNTCSHFQNSLPGYDITSPLPVDFNYSTNSGTDPVAVGNDLWYQFSPMSGNDGFGVVNSTSADITVTGLNAGEEITFLLYKGNTVSSNNCLDLTTDHLSTVTVSSDGTLVQGISCLDVTHGAANGGYLLRIAQTAGGTSSSPTVTITPSTAGPSNNVCDNIWNGSGATIGPTNNPNSDVLHDWNQFLILNGETVSGTFVGTNDCEYSTTCNSIDYGAIQEVNDRDAWYVFTVPDNECATLGLTQSTVLYSMDLTYDAGNAFRDGIMYVYSDCAQDSLIDCSGALDGEGETWTVDSLKQGQSYLLRVKPWDISSTPTDWTFDITLNNGNVAPCNDDAVNAESLSIGSCSNYSSLPVWSAQGATDSAPVSGAPESDVWFSFTAPSPSNGGSYTTSKSWVTVFFESVSGEGLWLELYNTAATEGGSLMEYTASGTGDQAFAQFGNLDPGETYWLRMYHKEVATVNVQYKIAISTGSGEEPGVSCGENDLASMTECSSPCGDLREEWFKIDLPDGTPGNSYWMIEVMGYDEYLDFELRSKYLSGNASYVNCNGVEGTGEGNCADFDHPCSSAALEPAVSISSTTALFPGGPGLTTSQNCDDGTTASPNEGRGVRRVYFNMNGAVAGQKDYYYLRVFMDPSSPNYTAEDDIHVCQLNFYGPYTTQLAAEAGGVPDAGDCIVNPTIAFTSATSTLGENGGTVTICAEIQNVDGTAVSADVVFDGTDAGTAILLTDYSLDQTLPYTLNFPATASNGDQLCITVTGIDDLLQEGDETINFDLTNPTGTATLGTIVEHTTTITDDDNGPDTDEDGIPDSIDLDDDNDGISDVQEGGPTADFDMDGIPNSLDLDSDNDGLADIVEANPTDADMNGVADIDEDGDGRVPVDANDDLTNDSDNNGWDNTYDNVGSTGTPLTPLNTDMNGNPDYLDIDADDDGIVDVIEWQPTTGYIAPSGVYGTDGWDDALAGVTMLNDLDGNGTPDYLDLDTDGDSENDTVEAYDTDDDGIADGLSGDTGDDDNDGLLNQYENVVLGIGTVATNPDNGGQIATNPFPNDDVNNASATEPDWRDIINVCGSLELKVFLEGAYDGTSGSMTTHLNDNHLLPGQDKLLSPDFSVRFSATHTPFGQPYASAPWNYTGNLGLMFGDASSPGASGTIVGYNNDVTDWVLVTVREDGILAEDNIWSCAGWLHSDGTISFPEACACLNIDTDNDYYILIEHRNHLGVLSPAPVNITNSGTTLEWDFTTSESYKPVFRFGQKELTTGVWGMFLGNGNQVVDRQAVNSSDQTIWKADQNAINYRYGDFNLNLISNSEDETLWKINQNKTSGIDY